MKKVVFVFFFHAIFISAKAQPIAYHPFPDSNATWRERTWFVDGLTMHEHKYQLFISGDSTIGNYVYHKIYITHEQTDYAYPQGYVLNYYFFGTSLSGFLRQDTAARKVYTYDSFSFTDTLVYDFNLNIGDTLPPSYNHSFGDPITITGIDSIYDGTVYRRRFMLSMGWGWIVEGIGSNAGLFNPIDGALFELACSLNCFMENDTIKFTDGSADACVLVDDIAYATQESKTVFVSPNPFHTSTKIFSSDGSITQGSFAIYSLLGTKVWEEKISILPSIISPKTLPAGIYEYVFQSHSPGSPVVGKLVIE